MDDHYLDLVNLLVIYFYITIILVVRLIPAWLAIALTLFAITPLLVNNLVFPTAYMPDQYRYTEITAAIRSLSFDYNDNIQILTAAWILFFVPIPFLETEVSLGLANRFIASALIIWLYAFKNIRGAPLYFLLIYPSLNLYSSVALRDTIVLTLMIISAVLYVDGSRLRSLAVSGLLWVMKFQNCVILFLFMFLHEFSRRRPISVGRIFLAFFLSLTPIYLYYPELLQAINKYRTSFAAESGASSISLTSIDSLFSLFITGFISSLEIFLNPTPWAASGGLEIIQSVENVFVNLFLIVAFLFVLKKDRVTFFKWGIVLLISMGIIGLTVVNLGTSVRYRFVFIAFAVVGIYYDLVKVRRDTSPMDASPSY